MKTLNYVECGNYFTAFNGSLINVEIYEIHLFMDGTVCYMAKYNNAYTTYNQDDEFYKSIQDFKDGYVVEKSFIDEHNVCKALNCNHVENDKFAGWVFNKNIAENVEFTLESITIVGNRIDSVSGSDKYGYKMPSKFYRSRQELLDNNIIKVEDEQGNISELVGIKVRIRLDEDQQAMANELKELIEKMRASGMAIVFDDINSTISAINTRNIGEVHTWSIVGEENFDYELDYEDTTSIVAIDSRVDDGYILGVDMKD